MPNYKHWNPDMASVFANALDQRRTNIYLANQFRTDTSMLLLATEFFLLFASAILSGNATMWSWRVLESQSPDPFSYWGGMIILNVFLCGLIGRMLLGMAVMTNSRRAYAVTTEMRYVLIGRIQHLCIAKTIFNGLVVMGLCVIGGRLGQLGVAISAMILFFWIVLSEMVGSKGYFRYFTRVA
jgi:hypothetical protein